VYVIQFPVHYAGVTNMSLHYNLSLTVKIYRRHRRVRSSSASQKDYRLVVIIGISIITVIVIVVLTTIAHRYAVKAVCEFPHNRIQS